MSARWSWSLAAAGLVLLGTWAFFRFASVTEVRGRVFIVQRDAHVNRLALLRVTAIPAEEAARWKDSRRADWRFLQRRLAENDRERTAEVAASVSPFDAKLSALAQQIAAASEALELADHAWTVDSKDLSAKRRFHLVAGAKDFPRSSELEAMATASDWFGVAKTLRDAVLPGLRLRVAELAAERVRKLAAVRLEFDERERALRRQTEDFFAWASFARLPGSLSVADADVSDDNGEFRLRLPPGDYVVFAEGRRAVNGKTENYLWAQPLTAGPAPDKFMLSNDNLAWLPGSFWYDLLQGRSWPETAD